MKRTCPKCKKRSRKIIAPSPHYFDHICAVCGYVFKEDRVDRDKMFWEKCKWILEVGTKPCPHCGKKKSDK